MSSSCTKMYFAAGRFYNIMYRWEQTSVHAFVIST